MEDEVLRDRLEHEYQRGFAAGAEYRRVVVWAQGSSSDDGRGGGRVLPAAFIDAYVRVCDAALRHPGATLGPDDRGLHVRPRVKGPRTSTGATESILQGRAGAKVSGASKVGGRGSASAVVLSDKWLAIKGKVDRRLRKIARELLEDLDGTDNSGRRLMRCGKCKRWGEGEWDWCPWDGSALEEVGEA